MACALRAGSVVLPDVHDRAVQRRHGGKEMANSATFGSTKSALRGGAVICSVAESHSHALTPAQKQIVCTQDLAQQLKEMASAEKRWESQVKDAKVNSLSPKEAGYAVDLSNYTLLDVRPSSERGKSWVKDSVWIPIFDLNRGLDPGTALSKLSNFAMGGWWSGSPLMEYNERFMLDVVATIPKSANVIVTCQKGLRSLAACEQLYKAGYKKLFWMKGGLDAAEEGDLTREGPEPFKFAGLGGVSEFLGWTDVQRETARKEGVGFRGMLFGRPAHASETIAADRRLKVEHDGDSLLKASVSVDSNQGVLGAREALEVNFAEVSSSSEETSGSGDAQVTINGFGAASTSTLVLDREPLTGGAVDFRGAASPLTIKPLVATKKIVLVRHGLSAWNAEGRIQPTVRCVVFAGDTNSVYFWSWQGSSDLSVLSEEGVAQAERCKAALANLKFSTCYASPISRAKTSAEVIWRGRLEPLVFLESLKEANLHFFEGMRNVDAKEQYPELFRAWREDPINFQLHGVYPVVDLWAQAQNAWQEILSAEGELILVVTHKSMLRALLCTALGMGPDRFRAMDINNGGISVFTINTRGEPLLQCLNMTAHMHAEGVFY